MKNNIKVPKNAFKNLNFEITLPTITCNSCGEEILATPENIFKNQFISKLY